MIEPVNFNLKDMENKIYETFGIKRNIKNDSNDNNHNNDNNLIIRRKTMNRHINGRVTPKSKQILLENVVLTFPSIWVKPVFTDKDGKSIEGKYTATFLIDKGDKMIDTLSAEVKRLIAYVPQGIDRDKICIIDGDETTYDLNQGKYCLKCFSVNPPSIVDNNEDQILEEENLVKPGCHVNAIIHLWLQDNAYGQRINANFHAIQFIRNGGLANVSNTKIGYQKGDFKGLKSNSNPF